MHARSHHDAEFAGGDDPGEDALVRGLSIQTSIVGHVAGAASNLAGGSGGVKHGARRSSGREAVSGVPTMHPRAGTNPCDAPHGVEIARTERDDGVANSLLVFRLGPATDGHVLVRYQEDEAFVVGWVPSADVQAFETKRLEWGRGGGIGLGSRVKVRVELPRGTRLVPTDSDEVVGVVTKTHELPCVLDCTGPNPHVRLRACSRELTLRAVP